MINERTKMINNQWKWRTFRIHAIPVTETSDLTHSKATKLVFVQLSWMHKILFTLLYFYQMGDWERFLGHFYEQVNIRYTLQTYKWKEKIFLINDLSTASCIILTMVYTCNKNVLFHLLLKKKEITPIFIFDLSTMK